MFEEDAEALERVNKTRQNIYRVAQNKPDYLLLLSKFCISAIKHVSMITYV